MDLWTWIFGTVWVELTCADAALALMELNSSGVSLNNAVCSEDGLNLRACIRQRDLKALKRSADKKGWKVRILKQTGLVKYASAILKRPVLCAGIAVLLAVSVWLPKRILFIRVEGNVTVPARLIAEAASQCGIGFGASASQVRSQKVKDALLESIDALDWAGVTTSGCVATVTVSERTAQPEQQQPACRSIVASRDGIITYCTAAKGKLMCHVGQAVKAGQLLISGYNDCGLKIQVNRAEGEIYAQTMRTLTALTPTQCSEKGQITHSEKKFAVIIGKNRINFYKGSGISGDSCVKMYEQYYITLPGSFPLPVAIVTETWCRTEPSSSETGAEEAQAILSDFAGRYLPSCMAAGKIMAQQEEFLNREGCCVLQGNYACHEMIGQVRNEEIIKPNGNDH